MFKIFVQNFTRNLDTNIILNYLNTVTLLKVLDKFNKLNVEPEIVK